MPTKRTMRDRWNKWFGAGHRAVLRASGGRVGRRIGKAPILLLTTTGRRSGQARTVPLMYWSDGDRFAIVASNAGQDHAPAWYGNLLAQPAVEIELLGERMAATARTASAEERSDLWPRLVGIWPAYESYEKKTSRPIPVVVLERR